MDEQNKFGFSNEGSFGDSGTDKWEETPHNPYNVPHKSADYADENDLQSGQPISEIKEHGNYPDQFYPDKWETQPDEENGYGFAILAFVTALINLLLLKSLLTIISLPLCIIFTVIVFRTKGQGKILAVLSIIISAVSAIICTLFAYILINAVPDFKYFIKNDNEIVSNYLENGTIPGRFSKYKNSKYDKYWEINGYDDFEDFFDDFVRHKYPEHNDDFDYDENDDSEDSDDPYFDDDDEIDDDGEDLVIL